MERLSKNYTANDIIDVLRSLANEIAPKRLKNPDLLKYINLANIQIVNQLGEILNSDYGEIINLSIASSGALFQQPPIRCSYDNSNQIVTLDGDIHNFTESDIGRVIVIYNPMVTDITITTAMLSYLEEIPNQSSFKLAHEFGQNISNARYFYFDINSINSIDISQYNISKITLLEDSSNGRIVKKNYHEFKELVHTSKPNGLYYSQFGQRLFFFKGNELNSYGHISMSYLRQPQPCRNYDDYIDLNDQYIPLLIAQSKSYMYEQLGMDVPQPISDYINNSVEEYKGNQISKEGN